MSSGAQAGAILTGLSKVNGILTLAVTGGEILIPIVSGIVKKIESKVAGQDTMEYTIVLSTGQQELTDAEATATSDLTEINKRLAAGGHPTIPVPTP